MSEKEEKPVELLHATPYLRGVERAGFEIQASKIQRLPGRYEGTRRRREPPTAASCTCGWKTRPMNPKRAEERYSRHVATFHTEIRS